MSRSVPPTMPLASDTRPGHGGVSRLDGPAADQLRSTVRGAVLLPDEPGYDEARRIWNGVIDRRPAAIVRCTGAADVQGAVNVARAARLPVSVRAGGHNVSGAAVRDGALMIDLSPMRGVRVDPDRLTVRAAGGATLGDIDHETRPFGLAVPMGVVSRTGIGGLALHGGIGFQTRMRGLASDNLVSADVVTGDGRLVVANEREKPDLLWGLRGGGGNFGIVTSFEFRAHPIAAELALAIVMYPVAMAREVLGFFRDFMADAPDEIMGIALLWNSPAEGPFPAEALNQPVAVLAAAFIGPADEGEQALRPFREVGVPLIDLSGRMPYVQAQRLFDPDFPDGRRYYWKSTYLRELNDDVIELLIEGAARRASPITSVDVWALGGAMGRVPPTASAFARRDAPFLLGIEANWDDPAADAANIRWARTLFDDAQRYATGGAYLNFPGFVEEGEALLRESYGENYERLLEVKRRYDPENLFQGGLNVGG